MLTDAEKQKYCIFNIYDKILAISLTTIFVDNVYNLQKNKLRPERKIFINCQIPNYFLTIYLISRKMSLSPSSKKCAKSLSSYDGKV